MEKSTLDMVQLVASVATAIGTIGAVITSLFFSMRDRRSRLDISTEIVYYCTDKKGQYIGYVISVESAAPDIILSVHHKFEYKLRVTAVNSGAITQYLNGFYFYVALSREPNLFIDNTKGIGGQNITNPIHPGESFTMLMPVNVLKSKHVQQRYMHTIFAQFRFRIAAETSLGRSFRNSVSPSVHKAIQS